MTLQYDIGRLADHFDAVGLHVIADRLDKIAIDYSERVVNPTYEHVFRALLNKFVAAAKDPNLPSITEKSLPDIIAILNAVSSTYMVAKHEFYVPEDDEYAFVPEEVYNLALAVATLGDDAKQLESTIAGIQDESKAEGLKMELASDREALKMRQDELLQYQSTDPKAYGLAMQFIQNRNIRLLPDRRQSSERRRFNDVPAPKRRTEDQ